MKIPKRVRQVANQIVKNAKKQRELNRELTSLLEDMGVDLGDRWIEEPLAFLEGDCDSQELFDYLEEL